MFFGEFSNRCLANCIKNMVESREESCGTLIVDNLLILRHSVCGKIISRRANT